MRDDRIQPHPFRFFLAAHARQFDGALERLFDRAERVQEHAFQAGLLCEIARHAGADDDAAAFGGQPVDGEPHFIDRAVGALCQADLQPRAQVDEFVRDRFMQDQADARARPPGRGVRDRVQHVEAVHLDHDDRHA
jgi:hypothetical protein